ncbi:hybrid sensor histidine kinase/response regulator [Flammeovirgaceae bacterium SG7u.111]|nr:hybrid sensor histidine kinase/response regulator [Flammeovirgaceae bacterium SG7u.132]WPO38146.1 hybrid sensor histidine kinase/response regulator [Flammeovirgaceae bacterium SG7u.111]
MNLPQEPRILYVDDEIENLDGFSITFLPYYEVLTSTSAKDGLKLLTDALKDDEPISVVISDQRMPEMDGIDFFKEVSDIAPDAIKILLTGYSDFEVITQAINAVSVYKYITKPWDKDELKETIDKAIELYRLRRENNELLTELKGVNNELGKSNNQLKSALKELEFFIYNTSHNFRQPLLSIKGLITLSEMENDPSVLQEHYKMIGQIIDEYDFFLQNVPELLKKTSVELESKEIDFSGMIKANLGNHTYLQFYKETKVEVEVLNSDVPFYSDEKRLKVLINNLISNAIKFQHPGRAEKKVNVRIVKEKDSVDIKIEDNGIGIMPSQQQMIFNMFFRGSEAHRGSGLGLYLVKQIAEVMQGTIEVSSEKDNFTCFHLTIPNLQPSS